MGAPCSQLIARSPGRKSSGGLPLNKIVRTQLDQGGYAQIDDVIDEWVARHKFKLFTEFAGGQAHAVYLSSNMGECFQIWIEPPESGQVSLHAGDIETRQDEVLREDWQTPVENLAAALENAVQHVHTWMVRK